MNREQVVRSTLLALLLLAPPLFGQVSYGTLSVGGGTALANGAFSIPVTLSLNASQSVDGLTFGVSVTPNGSAPPPGTIGFIPAPGRQTSGFVNVMPIGGVVPVQLLQAPGDAHFVEHIEVGGAVCVIGIQQGSVPVEKDTLEEPIEFLRHSLGE